MADLIVVCSRDLHNARLSLYAQHHTAKPFSSSLFILLGVVWILQPQSKVELNCSESHIHIVENIILLLLHNIFTHIALHTHILAFILARKSNAAMESLSEEQLREQGQQIQPQLKQTRPTAEQLVAIAAANTQKKKRKAPERFDQEMEHPLRRPEAPQSTGVHNRLFLPSSSTASQQQGQAINSAEPSSNSHKDPATALAPDHNDQNQELLISEANPDQANTDLRQQLREEIRKEMELEWESRLANRTLETDNRWRKKWKEALKEIENNHMQRVKEVEKYYKKKLAEAVPHGEGDSRSTKALHEEIDKLKKRLAKGPGLIKAAEERGRREGELDGYNKLSLNPDLKPSQDRENFDYLMKEKNKELADVKAARDSWFDDARKFSEKTNAEIRNKDQEIQRLQAQLETQPAQQPIAPDNMDALITEGRALQVRFDNQTLELLTLRQDYNQQADNLVNLITLVEKKSEESSEYKRQIGSKLVELSLHSEELRKRTEEVSSLRRENDRKSVELHDIKEELAKAWGQLKKQRGEHYENWLELGVYERQIRAQFKEIANLRARHRQVEEHSAKISRTYVRHGDSESSHQEKDGIIASLRELLDKPNHHQPTQPDHEEAKHLKKRLAKSESKLAKSESRLNAALSQNASLQNQYGIEKALNAARGKLRIARTQASISWSHLEHARSVLDEQNAALADVSLDKPALDTRVRELEAQLGRAISTLGANRTQLKEAGEKAAELVTANRRVAELEAEKAEMKSQDTNFGPKSMPPEFYSDAAPPPTKRFGKYRHKPSPANETRDEHRQKESASDDVFRRVLGIKKAETDEEKMFQPLRIPPATVKAILEKIKASKRPTIESPAIIVSELIGVPVEIAQVIIRSMMFREPTHPATRQLIAAELLLGVSSDVAEEVTANPEGIVATLKKRQQGTQTESLPTQQVVPIKIRSKSQVPWYLQRNSSFWITLCSLFAVFLAFGFPDSLPADLIVARTTALARVARPTEDGWWLDELVEPLQELISEFREAAGGNDW